MGYRPTACRAPPRAPLLISRTACACVLPPVLCRQPASRPGAHFTLTHARLPQTTLPSPGQPTKEPVLIPVRMGLLGPDGAELPLKLRG